MPAPIWAASSSAGERTTRTPKSPRHAPTNSTLAATEAETHSQSTSPPTHGWKIHASSGSQILAIENVDQGLARTDVDATNKYLDIAQSIDWSQPDEVDIAATADAPRGWNAPAGPARVYLSVHIDCTR